MKTCKHCGAPLEPYKRICPHCGHSQFDTPPPPKYNTSFMIKILAVIISLMIIAVIAGMIFIGVRLMHSHVNFDFHPQNSEHNIPETQFQHVDVLSTDFSTHYMNTSRIEGYQNFQMNHTRARIESRFGKPEQTFTVNNIKIFRYGDMGVSYNNNQRVNHIWITPKNVSVQAFTEAHGQPDVYDGHAWYYDKNKHNAYTIKVYVKDGQIVAIENIPQI